MKEHPEKYCEQCGKKFQKRSPARTKESRFCGYSCSGKFHISQRVSKLNSPEANLKKSLKLDAHPRWKPDRKMARGRPSPERRIFKESVLSRDGRKCLWCGSTKDLIADHIKPYAIYPELRWDINNGRTLCQTCHRKTDTYGLSPKSYFLIPLADKIKEVYSTGMYTVNDIARYHGVAESVMYRIITGKVAHRAAKIKSPV